MKRLLQAPSIFSWRALSINLIIHEKSSCTILEKILKSNKNYFQRQPQHIEGKASERFSHASILLHNLSCQ